MAVSIPITTYSWQRITNTYLIYSPPAVNVTIGDTLVMNVHNSLNEPTALHAHGQFQNGTNWMDGHVMVTQW
jgi:iron transport multicopper oxidase